MDGSVKKLLLIGSLVVASIVGVHGQFPPDLTTMLSKFLVDLRAGTLGVANPISSIALGTNPAPTGAIRLSNAGLIQGMTTGGVDTHILSLNSSDNVALGTPTIPTAIRTSGAAPTLGNSGWWWLETNDGTSLGTSAAFMSRFNSVVRMVTPSIRATGRVTAQTAAVASVSAFTVGATDASFEISANVLVTTATTHSFTVTCAYTDEGNTARTLTLSFSQLAGTIITAITNVTGAGPYEGVSVHIRAKAATAITIATVGTFTTVTYNAEGNIRQIS